MSEQAVEVGDDEGGVPLSMMDFHDTGYEHADHMSISSDTAQGSSHNSLSSAEAPLDIPTMSPPNPSTVDPISPDDEVPNALVQVGLSEDMFTYMLDDAASQAQDATFGHEYVPSQTLQLDTTNGLTQAHTVDVLDSDNHVFQMAFEASSGGTPVQPSEVPGVDQSLDDEASGQTFESFIVGHNGADAQPDLATNLVPPLLHPRYNESWDIETFFEKWKYLWMNCKTQYPSISNLAKPPPQVDQPSEITPQDVLEKKCDMQGINWYHFQATRADARKMRRQTTENFTSVVDRKPTSMFATPDYESNFRSDWSPALSLGDSFFTFRETKTRPSSSYSHWQLRHNVSASSRNAIFYYTKPDPVYDTESNQVYTRTDVKCLNPSGNSIRKVMNLRHLSTSDFPRMNAIACLCATNGFLILGGLNEGLYAMKSLSLSAETEPTMGMLSSSASYHDGVNHVHTFLDRRSGLPQAAFTTNDSLIQILDCKTNTIVSQHRFCSPVNASATSPDGRLRIHVSDNTIPLVTDAENGRILARLPDHRDHGFACAWSPDGLNMATGHQDGIVQIWDARKMSQSVHALPAEMGGVRALEYSPLGSGPPVLAMAEPVDFVSVVDARTYNSKQNIEFLGEISGISFPPDGDTLFVGNADPMYGGIMEFGRTGQSKKSYFEDTEIRSSVQDHEDELIYEDEVHALQARCRDGEHARQVGLQRLTQWQTKEYDWALQQELKLDGRVKRTKKQRWRRNIGLEKMVF